MFRLAIFIVIASAINEVDHHAAQPCWRCFPQWQHKSLWPTHLLQWQLQRDQLHCRCHGAFAMMKDHDWCNYHGRFGVFTIVVGCGPVALGGKGPVIALHNVRGPNAAYHCFEQHTRSVALVVRVSLLYPAQSSSLARGLLLPSLARGFLCALLGKHGLLGILTVLAFGALHTVFGILTVLDLGIFTLLVIAWWDMVLVTSCKWKHENLIVAWESLCLSLALIVLLSLLVAILQ